MTSLILSLTCAPNGIPFETRRIDSDQYSLGRDPDNDWILLDPGCRVSRHHCRIVRDGDDWIVADLSRNGTRHESGHPLGMNGNAVGTHRLASGDRLHLGDYEISVTVQEDESSFQIMPLPDFIEDLRRNFTTRPSSIPGRDGARGRQGARRPALPYGGDARRIAGGGDPLLEMLGLEGAGLPPARRSVILYRLGASLSTAVHGLRRLLKTSHVASVESGSRLLAEGHTTSDILRAIAGMDGMAADTPEQMIGDAFDALQRHQACVALAYRRCLMEMLDAMNPDAPMSPQGRERGWAHQARLLAFLRRQYRRISTDFDTIVDASFARYYREEWVRLASGAGAPRPD